MRRALFSFCVSALLVAASAPAARPYTYQFTTSSLVIRWPLSSTINIQLGNSLRTPPANIRATGSQVEAAARRALQRWSEAANINFNVTVGATELTIDDGVNVISVSTVNSTFVGGGERTGRARVEFDPNTGVISEADMAINPNLPFSTDGTHDTYDLESVFVHEIGHMLGLDHSGVVGATMQPRQVRNFLGLTQFSPRTLSDDDIAGIRSLYNRTPRRPSGSIAGSVTFVGGASYGAGAHVFAENIATGRVHGSAITQANGSYRIDHLPEGAYRVVVEFLDEPVFANEITASRGPFAGIGSGAPFPVTTAQTNVTAGGTSGVNVSVGGANLVNLRRHGLLLNGTAIVHGGPMPLTPPIRLSPNDTGVFRYYVAGEGVDQIPAANFSFTTPFITLDPGSRAVENQSAFGLNFPIVSFNIRVADTAKVGDYSLRVQAASGEIAYLAGAIVVDPYTDRVELNPIDAHDFFVRQQYRDFLFREPEPGGLQAWLNVLNGCPNAFNTSPTSTSAGCDRNTVSASFFRSREFEVKGRYIFNFYRVGLNRSPTFTEFIADMQFITGATEAEVNQKRDQFATSFAARAEFQPTAVLPNDQFVNTLMDRYALQSVTTPDPANPNGSAKVTLARADLINRLNTGALTKAQVLRAIADSDEVLAAEFNRGFVTMQYFGYLRRDPDPSFTSWLNLLNANPTDFYTMVNGFVNSQEYRTRFGQP